MDPESKTLQAAVPRLLMQQHKYPEIVVDCGCEIGENPIWHPLENRLYWCDIPQGRIFRFDPATGIHEACYEGDAVGGFTIQSDGSLLLFMARGAIKIFNKGKMTTVIREIEAERNSRFNDVIADTRGRVFCGTMSTTRCKGRLYRLDLDGKLHVVLENIGCSNGMAFSLDRKRMYYTDSDAREIYIFDYREDTGELSNQRIFAKVDEGDGLPDGATIDAEDGLWSARWDGGCIVRYLPTGELDRRVEIPARKASSLTFGGVSYTNLYITTAGGQDKKIEGRAAGSLLKFTPGFQGIPEFASRIML